MSEFCNKCSNEMFGKDTKPDIDVRLLAHDLTPGHYFNVLCEGCGMIAVAKEEDGLVKVVYLTDEDLNDNRLDEHDTITETLEEWENKSESIRRF